MQILTIDRNIEYLMNNGKLQQKSSIITSTDCHKIQIEYICKNKLVIFEKNY